MYIGKNSDANMKYDRRYNTQITWLNEDSS